MKRCLPFGLLALASVLIAAPTASVPASAQDSDPGAMPGVEIINRPGQSKASRRPSQSATSRPKKSGEHDRGKTSSHKSATSKRSQAADKAKPRAVTPSPYAPPKNLANPEKRPVTAPPKASPKIAAAPARTVLPPPPVAKPSGQRLTQVRAARLANRVRVTPRDDAGDANSRADNENWRDPAPRRAPPTPRDARGADLWDDGWDDGAQGRWRDDRVGPGWRVERWRERRQAMRRFRAEARRCWRLGARCDDGEPRACRRWMREC